MMQTRWIVIPTFGDVEGTDRCLAGLYSSPVVGYHVLIVDHSPGLRVVSALRQRYPLATFIHAPPDLWWTGATNAGIRQALAGGASQVMLLNCDCVIAPDSVAALFVEASRGVSVVAPVQRDLNSGHVTAVRAWTALILGFPTLYISRTVGERRTTPTSMICGGRGVVIGREVLESIGYFAEEALPHYAADHDFYFRCRKAGIPLMIHTGATVYVDSATTSLAQRAGDLSLAQFIDSLKNRRSHRNLGALAALFRRNYPIKSLWRIGYGLAVARYFAVWIIKRPLTLAASLVRRRERKPLSDPDGQSPASNRHPE